MTDRIEKLGDSLIHHGPANNRIYLMKLGKDDPTKLIMHLKSLAQKNGYGKIVVKIPESVSPVFIRNGFAAEASIPGFFQGKESAIFLSLFRDEKRRILSDQEESETQANLELAQGRKQDEMLPELSQKFRLRLLDESDINQLQNLYKIVFPSYPFPIHDPDYLCETMQSHVKYFGAFCQGTLLACASSETDPVNLNAEMTDFATHPDAGGQRLALHLLRLMEETMVSSGYRCLYTIARSYSAPMNITFSRNGYFYTGTLVNNTDIFGKIENMNVWTKALT